MNKCPAVWSENENPQPGESVWPCDLSAGHDGVHFPQEDPVEYIPSVDSPSADIANTTDLTPHIAGSFALYPHGKTLYGVAHFDIPEGIEDMRGPVPAEFVELFLSGKKPSPMQLAKIAMTMMAG